MIFVLLLLNINNFYARNETILYKKIIKRCGPCINICYVISIWLLESMSKYKKSLSFKIKILVYL